MPVAGETDDGEIGVGEERVAQSPWYLAYDGDDPTHRCRKTGPEGYHCTPVDGVAPDTEVGVQWYEAGLRVDGPGLTPARKRVRVAPLRYRGYDNLGPLVRVANDAVWFGDERVAELEAGRVAARHKKDGKQSMLVIEPLKAIGESAQGATVPVAVDQAAHYRTATEVMVSLARADVGVILVGKGDVRTVRLLCEHELDGAARVCRPSDDGREATLVDVTFQLTENLPFRGSWDIYLYDEMESCEDTTDRVERALRDSQGVRGCFLDEVARFPGTDVEVTLSAGIPSAFDSDLTESSPSVSSNQPVSPELSACLRARVRHPGVTVRGTPCRYSARLRLSAGPNASVRLVEDSLEFSRARPSFGGVGMNSRIHDALVEKSSELRRCFETRKPGRYKFYLKKKADDGEFKGAQWVEPDGDPAELTSCVLQAVRELGPLADGVFVAVGIVNP